MKDKPFAGGVRPSVYVEPLKIFNEGTIDVIVIKNNFNTPFYLTKRYNKVNANNIYTRVMDNNTAIDSSADLIHIEYLWKKRFRLISTPIERIQYYLQYSQDWVISPDEVGYEKKYYKYSPEYTIELVEDDNDGYAFYLFNQHNTTPHWANIKLFYYQTQIEKFQVILLDNGVYLTPIPEKAFISLDGTFDIDVELQYFVKNSLRYIVHEFFYTVTSYEEIYSHDKFMECVIVFDSDNELERFKKFVKEEWKNNNEYSDGIRLQRFKPVEGHLMSVFEKQYKEMQILKKMYKKFVGR